MLFAIGDRVRRHTGGSAMTVVRVLNNGDLECRREVGPSGKAEGHVRSHSQASLQSAREDDREQGSHHLRSEAEPSDADLGFEPIQPNSAGR